VLVSDISAKKINANLRKRIAKMRTPKRLQTAGFTRKKAEHYGRGSGTERSQRVVRVSTNVVFIAASGKTPGRWSWIA
jgi:ribosomal protein L3